MALNSHSQEPHQAARLILNFHFLQEAAQCPLPHFQLCLLEGRVE